MTPSLITISDLTFGYGSAPVIAQCSASLPEGGRLLVQGPSGSGKSTLLRLLVKLEHPWKGSIALRGTPYDTLPTTVLRRHVALLQQLPVMIDGSIRDNLLPGFRFRTDQPPDDAQLVTLLARAGLRDLDLRASAQGLSVGQKQRIALMRLLLLNPAVLLLDEPAASLDAASADIINSWIDEVNAAGTAVVLVSHHDESARADWPTLIMGSAQ